MALPGTGHFRKHGQEIRLVGLLLEDGTLPPGKASSATRIIDLVATLTNAVERRPNVAETSLMVAVLDALASPDARYRRTHNRLARNLPKAEFRGKLVQPSPAEISRDAEVRQELLALAAEVEGGTAARPAARFDAGAAGDGAGPG